jgi:hypothetical protein
MFEILVDDHKFYLSTKSLQNYPESVLSKVLLDGHADGRITNGENGTIYVDADYKTFYHIISHVRGYTTDLTEFNYDAILNIKRDAEYFGFIQLYDELSNKYIGGGTVQMQDMDTETYTDTDTDSVKSTDLEEIDLGDLGIPAEYDLDRDTDYSDGVDETDEIDEQDFALIQQQLFEKYQSGGQNPIPDTSEPVTIDMGDMEDMDDIPTDLAGFCNDPRIMKMVQEANARDTESDIDEDIPQLTPNYISLV